MKFFTWTFWICITLAWITFFSGGSEVHKAAYMVGGLVSLGVTTILEKLEELKPKC